MYNSILFRMFSIFADMRCLFLFAGDFHFRLGEHVNRYSVIKNSSNNNDKYNFNSKHISQFNMVLKIDKFKFSSGALNRMHEYLTHTAHITDWNLFHIWHNY